MTSESMGSFYNYTINKPFDSKEEALNWWEENLKGLEEEEFLKRIEGENMEQIIQAMKIILLLPLTMVAIVFSIGLIAAVFNLTNKEERKKEDE